MLFCKEIIFPTWTSGTHTMQPPPTQPQGHTQDCSTCINQGLGYIHRSSPVRTPHPWFQPTPQALNFTQPGTPHHDLRPRTQRNLRNTVTMQPGGGNDAYMGHVVNGFSRTSTNSLTGAPPPWRSEEYVPQYFPYGHFGQGGINHTGFPVAVEQVSNNSTNFSNSFPGTSAQQSNQGATPVWQLFDLNWVNHEAQGELHLTIVFRRAPFA